MILYRANLLPPEHPEQWEVAPISQQSADDGKPFDPPLYATFEEAAEAITLYTVERVLERIIALTEGMIDHPLDVKLIESLSEAVDRASVHAGAVNKFIKVAAAIIGSSSTEASINAPYPDASHLQ